MRSMGILLPVVCAVLLAFAGSPLEAADGIVEVDRLAAVDGLGDEDWMALDDAGEGGHRPRLARAKLLKAERVAGALGAKAKGPGGAKTVTVDCAKGQSIQAAIDQNEGPVVIEILGVCLENVRIERKAVTLRGSDPATDGIQGVVADPQPLAALQIYYSDGVRLENLSIGDGPAIGVGMWFSHVTVENLLVTGNAGTGLHVSSSSFLDALDLTLSENGGRGLNVQRGSLAFCTGCTLADNAAFAAVAATGGLLSLLDSMVSGLNGLAASNESYADIDCVNAVTTHPCSLHVTRRAAQSIGAGTVAFWGAGDFSGQLVSGDRSLVSLLGARQLSTGQNPSGAPRANIVGFFGMLAAEPIEDELGVVQQSKLVGDTQVDGFSETLLLGETELDGTLECGSAGDAWADSTVVLAPGSSITGCEHAPPPSP